MPAALPPGKVVRKTTVTLSEPWEGENMTGGFQRLTINQLEWFIARALESGATDTDPVIIRPQVGNHEGYELVMEFER